MSFKKQYSKKKKIRNHNKHISIKTPRKETYMFCVHWIFWLEVVISYNIPFRREFSEGETSSSLSILKYQKPMIAWKKTGKHIGGSLRLNSERETPSPLSVFKYQKPILAWSETANHIGGSLPRFMRKFGKRETPSRTFCRS